MRLRRLWYLRFCKAETFFIFRKVLKQILIVRDFRLNKLKLFSRVRPEKLHFLYSFSLESSDLNFNVFYPYMRSHYYFNDKIGFLICYTTLHSARMLKFHDNFIFFKLGFLSQTLTLHEKARKSKIHLYSSLLFPLAHELSNIYLQFIICHDNFLDANLMSYIHFSKNILKSL